MAKLQNLPIKCSKTVKFKLEEEKKWEEEQAIKTKGKEKGITFSNAALAAQNASGQDGAASLSPATSSGRGSYKPDRFNKLKKSDPTKASAATGATSGTNKIKKSDLTTALAATGTNPASKAGEGTSSAGAKPGGPPSKAPPPSLPGAAASGKLSAALTPSKPNLKKPEGLKTQDQPMGQAGRHL